MADVCKNVLHMCSKRILSPSGQVVIDDYTWTSSFAKEGRANSRWHPATHGGFRWDVSSLIDIFGRMLTFPHLYCLHRIRTFCVLVGEVVFSFVAIHFYVP